MTDAILSDYEAINGRLGPVSYGSWDFDISRAPKGNMVTRYVATKDGKKPFEAFEADHVILATKCGKVTVSYWIPDESRWCMLSKGEEPVAWQRWPDHPDAEASKSKHTEEAGA